MNIEFETMRRGEGFVLNLGAFNTGDCLLEVTAWVGLTVY
jgi:hypothetical protein